MNEIKLSDSEKDIMKLSGKTVDDKTAGPALRNVFFKYLNDNSIKFKHIDGVNSPALIEIKNELCDITTKNSYVANPNSSYTIGVDSVVKVKNQYNDKWHIIFLDVNKQNKEIDRIWILASDTVDFKELMTVKKTKLKNTEYKYDGVYFKTLETYIKTHDLQAKYPKGNFEEWLKEV